MEMNIYEVMRRIPHRYPFLLIDKVIDCVPDKSLVAVKNITVNEPCFQGHFPEFPVYPGVLILEAMAQATGLLTFASMDTVNTRDDLFVLAGIDEARFKRQVLPGDVVILKAEVVRKTRRVWKFVTESSVDGQIVATAEILGALAPKG
jgi:3-hydroxyacyl-[acyl-carrier-protein] dehydratase